MERRNQTSPDAMTASTSRDFRAQGMKKDLYPHGSRELVDPKWSGAASKSNFARRDDGVPFTRFPRAGSRTSP